MAVVIYVNVDYFLLLMACFCCTSKCSVREILMVEIKSLKIDVVFLLVFVKNSKRHTHYIVLEENNNNVKER